MIRISIQYYIFSIFNDQFSRIVFHPFFGTEKHRCAVVNCASGRMLSNFSWSSSTCSDYCVCLLALQVRGRFRKFTGFLSFIMLRLFFLSVNTIKINLFLLVNLTKSPMKIPTLANFKWLCRYVLCQLIICV